LETSRGIHRKKPALSCKFFSRSFSHSILRTYSGNYRTLRQFKHRNSLGIRRGNWPEEEDHAHSKIDARKILISDGIHNVADGILLGASFAVSSYLGMITALSILIHEIVQEVSEFFVLKEAGYSTKKALITNFLISATILIGSIGSFFLLENFEMLEAPILGIAAGSFLVVVFHDLIPHSVRISAHHKQFTKHFIWFAIGLIIMLSLNSLVGHSFEPELEYLPDIANMR
jgi:zinc transporter ZupT